MVRPIKGYENKYEISDKGEVFSLNFHRQGVRKQLKERFDKDGYVGVALLKNRKYKYFRISRLVAQAFIPNPNDLPQVNHKNGDKTDNSVENLEWSTGSENIRHSFKVLGKNQKGEKNNNSKLTEAQVIAVWDLKGKKTQKEISRMFGVAMHNVDNIHSQRCWKWLTDSL